MEAVEKERWWEGQEWGRLPGTLELLVKGTDAFLQLSFCLLLIYFPMRMGLQPIQSQTFSNNKLPPYFLSHAHFKSTNTIHH